jgi:small neutral amino acid transporter SnatA (MarC family)
LFKVIRIRKTLAARCDAIAGGLGIYTRIMGLILAVVGVQMVIDGVAGAIQVAQ